MLELVNLSATVGDFQLRDITLAVPTHTIHVILGPSGSGKTLLLEAIAGFNQHHLSGEIRLNGDDITHRSPEHRHFAYVPQDLALFPHLNVEENIFFSHKIGGVDKILPAKRLALELAESMGVRALFKRDVKSLSGGERQRVALVRALATGNRHLLLDEPFNGLDAGKKNELWFLLKEVQVNYQLTVVMITHDLEEAFLLGDMISVLINGRIEQSDIKKDARIPKTFAVANLYGIRNIFRSRVRRVLTSVVVEVPDLGLQLSGKQFAWPLEQVGDAPSELKVAVRSRDVILSAPLDLGELGVLTPSREEFSWRGSIKSCFEKQHSATVMVSIEACDIILEVELDMPQALKLMEAGHRFVVVTINPRHIFPIFAH